jgi:hypothetical protein
MGGNPFQHKHRTLHAGWPACGTHSPKVPPQMQLFLELSPHMYLSHTCTTRTQYNLFWPPSSHVLSAFVFDGYMHSTAIKYMCCN